MEPAVGAASPSSPLNSESTHDTLPCISHRVEGFALQPVPHHELLEFFPVEVVAKNHLVVTVLTLANGRERHPVKDKSIVCYTPNTRHMVITHTL